MEFNKKKISKTYTTLLEYATKETYSMSES